MRILACALALFFAAGPVACKPEDPAPLEAERAKLLESTVLKDEYWHEVERKGTALREQKAADQRSARAAAERAQIATASSELAQRIAESQAINANASAQLDGLTQQIGKLQTRQGEIQRFLAQTGPPDVGAKGP